MMLMVVVVVMVMQGGGVAPPTVPIDCGLFEGFGGGDGRGGYGCL